MRRILDFILASLIARILPTSEFPFEAESLEPTECLTDAALERRRGIQGGISLGLNDRVSFVIWASDGRAKNLGGIRWN